MILPDVNVLIYAFDRGAPEHDDYAPWLRQLVAGGDEIALHEHCLLGLVRITTRTQGPRSAVTASAAMEFVNWLTDARRARWLTGGPPVLGTFERLLHDDPAIKGKRVPDAYLAALSIHHGCRFATRDRDFARYRGLDFFDPADEMRA